jgi:hypothetical protein
MRLLYRDSSDDRPRVQGWPPFDRRILCDNALLRHAEFRRLVNMDVGRLNLFRRSDTTQNDARIVVVERPCCSDQCARN